MKESWGRVCAGWLWRKGGYLACTAAGDDGVVLNGPLDNHDGVVQTPLYLGDELLGASSEDERACFGCGTSLEEVEPLSSYLSLLKSLTCAEMLWLDVRTG